ncbi:endonuclease/exonuclease/phosphatase family protein [Luteolibacter sp. GHJ8]|uniref:Endonuclease/exonuclease/phosphatase family protein n=1 Tax=Luteolibacter rhizosphaerae TaxID=2989719 RepID=A0ABT3G2K6_9BACT|nr:endonuclease/exonuclease/phosphatase family protein [Luteolibacter rhizosphaerae]MCW1914076.1 endonuclease/exonuclease/phosphatase family protein [Luteolibacter rhizosphaerae]
MKWRSFLLPKPKALVLRLAVLGSLLPILGWCGGSYWLLDLFNHFQWQYAGLLGIAVIALLLMRQWRFAAVAGILLCIPLLRIHLGTRSVPQKPSPGSPMKFTCFNVLTANQGYEDVVRWIRETDPDVIFLPEVDEVWAGKLRPLLESHPHAVEHPVEGNFGFACYSKLPILQREIIPCGAMELPLLKIRVQGESGSFVFLGAHPVPPANEFWAGERDEFLRIIAAEMNEEKGLVIVAGDLNATPWSYGVKPLRDAGLRGWEAVPTWSRSNPLLAVPIDHLLYRAGNAGPIEDQGFIVGPDLGSDHRPVTRMIAW